MDQRLSLITLGVEDVARASDVLRGARAGKGTTPDADVWFFQAGGMVFALWDRAKLAEDSGVEDPGGSSGFTLALNVRSPEEVDAVIEEVRGAGGSVTREPDETFWGGYSVAFTDPDGHPWEVAHNPFWTITNDGRTLARRRMSSGTRSASRGAGRATGAPTICLCRPAGCRFGSGASTASAGATSPPSRTRSCSVPHACRWVRSARRSGRSGIARRRSSYERTALRLPGARGEVWSEDGEGRKVEQRARQRLSRPDRVEASGGRGGPGLPSRRRRSMDRERVLQRRGRLRVDPQALRHRGRGRHAARR